MVVTGHGMDIRDQSLTGIKEINQKINEGLTLVSCPISYSFALTHLHGWPQQNVSALVSGHLGITRLPVVSNFYYYTATVEDVDLGD